MKLIETPILDKLSEERIFDVTKNSDGTFNLVEGCDNYFSINLTPAELMQLTVELRQLLKINMPKPSEIFDTPAATGFSRVGGNEEIIKELIEDWYKFPPELRHSNDSILRIVLAKALTTKDQEKEEAIAKACDQEAKLWFETWYSHYISPTKPLAGEFARFATERIQMTGYERDQALPREVEACLPTEEDSRVGGNEEIIKELTEDWYKFPPELRHSNDSILRIVLAKALTTKDQEKEEAVRAERARIKALFPKLNPNSTSWGTAEMERILKALPTEDNK